MILNLFATYWPSLLRLGYVSQFITPIVRATRGTESHSFYTYKQFNDWIQNQDQSQWHIKLIFPREFICRYYKGLGTSTAKEGKEYFSELDSHVIPFKPITQPEEDLIDMCFRRKRCEERKEWMNEWTEDRVVDYCGVFMEFHKS